MNHVRDPHPKSGVEPEGKVIPMAAYRLSKGGAPTCLGDPDFRRAYQDAGAEIGRINILVLGKTGVGKSTLVNAIFGCPVAETGLGRPVTQGSKMHVHADGHLGLIDTQGLELGRDSAELINELTTFIAQQRQNPMSEQLHLAWVCVDGQNTRFEAAEEEIVRELVRLGIPVILVMTQVPLVNGEVHSRSKGLMEAIHACSMPIVDASAIPTSALGDRDLKYGPHGLTELVNRSVRVAPDGVRTALVAAQKIDMESKRAEVSKVIAVATGVAAAAGLSPVPGSDAPVLIAVQLAMMMKIAHVFGISISTATKAALLATSATTVTGRSLVSGLLKLVPGVNLVAMAACAITAGSLTMALGWSWNRVVQAIANGDLDPMSIESEPFLTEVFRAAGNGGRWTSTFGT